MLRMVMLVAFTVSTFPSSLDPLSDKEESTSPSSVDLWLPSSGQVPKHIKEDNVYK